MTYEQAYVNYAKARLEASKTDFERDACTKLLADAERELAKQQANYCID